MLCGLGENRNVRLKLLFCTDNCRQCLHSPLEEWRKAVKWSEKVKNTLLSWHFSRCTTDLLTWISI